MEVDQSPNWSCSAKENKIRGKQYRLRPRRRWVVRGTDAVSSQLCWFFISGVELSHYNTTYSQTSVHELNSFLKVDRKPKLFSP
jgi:hypothetical protein